MIEKERLKELIEQESTIYYFKYKCIYTIKLYKDFYIRKQKLCRYLEYKNGKVYMNTNLKYLYETKEEAEFKLRYYTKKTIKFEPPTFESVCKELETNKNELSIIKFNGDEIKIVNIENSQIIRIVNDENQYDYKEFTKENYYFVLDGLKSLVWL